MEQRDAYGDDDGNDYGEHDYDISEATMRARACSKWQHHPPEVLPLWVADMDFPVAEPIKAALREHAQGDNFGYPPAGGLPGLREAVAAHWAERHGLTLEPERFAALNGIVPGLFMSVLALSAPGDEILMCTPIYGPFLMACEKTGRRAVQVPLVRAGASWELDLDALEGAVTPATRVLMLCNPHNPVGRVFRLEELEALAELALRHRLWVVSDELHADLVFAGARHLPFAALSSEVGARTLTLLGPTKAFNIAGLKIGFAASHDPKLLERVMNAGAGLVGAPNVLAQAATVAAYRAGGPWLARTLGYLRANRDFLAARLAERLPEVGFLPPEGTYLAWLDLRAYGERGGEEYLLEHARLALNDGAWFGAGGAGFVRLNFATSRGILETALARLERALAA